MTDAHEHLEQHLLLTGPSMALGSEHLSPHNREQVYNLVLQRTPVCLDYVQTCSIRVTQSNPDTAKGHRQHRCSQRAQSHSPAPGPCPALTAKNTS